MNSPDMLVSQYIPAPLKLEHKSHFRLTGLGKLLEVKRWPRFALFCDANDCKLKYWGLTLVIVSFV